MFMLRGLRRGLRVTAGVMLVAGGVYAVPALAHAAPVTVVAAHGFQPESFAYPFSDVNTTVETQVVQYCGDNSGRLSFGVDDKSVFAETIPPADPYATRTPADPKQGTTVATIEGYVTAAEQNGGGWVQLTFHHICSQCDAYSITAANMQALLDWLETQVTAGTVVIESTRQVIGGPFVTPFCC